MRIFYALPSGAIAGLICARLLNLGADVGRGWMIGSDFDKPLPISDCAHEVVHFASGEAAAEPGRLVGRVDLQGAG